jgi:hypothetical protein
MARKIRQLIRELMDAGLCEIQGKGKRSHGNFTHVRYHGAVTLGGMPGDDTKPYQEKQVQRAVTEVRK